MIRFFAKLLDKVKHLMGIILGIIASLIVAVLLIISLRGLFEKNEIPGVVEQNLDLALEVELIVEAIERAANNE